jgi:predicted transcriptional regulator
MTTLTIAIPDDLAAKLAERAREDGRDASALAGDVLRDYLTELEEDEEDARISLGRLADPDARTYTTDEVRKALGIEKPTGDEL